MSINLILPQLSKVKQTRHNQWLACCPAHKDKSPSLGIQLLSDGRILMNCLAGCGVLDVLQSLNLNMSDLFPDGGLGEFQSFETLRNKIQASKNQKQQEEISHEELILNIADSQRKRGERLSKQDLDREAKAFMRARNANH